jgi:hypothetical protein
MLFKALEDSKYWGTDEMRSEYSEKGDDPSDELNSALIWMSFAVDKSRNPPITGKNYCLLLKNKIPATIRF